MTASENYCAPVQERRGGQHSKSSSLIRSAGCYQRLRKFNGVKSVLKIETRLEGGQSQRRFLKIKREAMLHPQSENIKIRVFLR